MKNTLILWAYSAALLGASLVFTQSNAPASLSAFDQTTPTPTATHTPVGLKPAEISAAEGAERQVRADHGQPHQAKASWAANRLSPDHTNRKQGTGQGTRAAEKMKGDAK